MPNPKKYDYVNETIIVPVPEIKEYCYKQSKSDDILIYSAFEGHSDQVKSQPVAFIDPKESDRLLLQYSILVKQYSISSKEYEFWYNMKQINEKGGDIFALQPFPIVSNVHNVNNRAERSAGLFPGIGSKGEKNIYSVQQGCGNELSRITDIPVKGSRWHQRIIRDLYIHLR